jgi:DNA-binding transcriptional LysR family regulator
VASTGKYVIPFLLSPFLKKYQNIELMLDVTNKTKVIESLIKNEVDFALVSVIPEKMNIQKIKLMPNKLFLVGNKEKTFDSVSNDKSILESIPLIFREEGSATRYIAEKYLAKNKIKPTKKVEFSSNEALKQAILAGMGISILPLLGMKDQLNDGSIQISPIDEVPVVTNWRLVWLKNKSFSPAARAFLTYLSEEKLNIQIIII